MSWRAVLFDLDDTLYSRAQVYRRMAQQVAEDLVGPSDDHSPEEIVLQLIAWDAEEYPGISSARARQVLFGRCLDAYPSIGMSVAELVEWYHEKMFDSMRPDPATSKVLDRLNELGIKWGVITNGDHSQLRKIEKLELDIHPDQVVLSDAEGMRKPDVKLFDLAIDRLGMDRSSGILMVGDNDFADIKGARDAGIEIGRAHV